MATHLIITVVCSLICLALLWRRRSAVDGTTLLGPLRWSFFSLLSLLVSELLIFVAIGSDASTSQAVRYVAATTSFCPPMAILGAKRPQNIGWQFIVGSLWIVLILPAVEIVLLWRGGQLNIGAAREWFLVVLLFVGLSNYLPTRYGLTSVLLTAGQIWLLQDHLPWVSRVVQFPAAGLVLITMGMIVAGRRPGLSRGGWDGVWIDFRDAFGTVWALRVLERINATAQLGNWNLRLGWYGFEKIGEATKEQKQQDEEIQRAMRTLLRRFVSTEWIDRRIS